MDCEEVRIRLQESLEGSPLPPGAKAHLRGCGACAELRDALATVHGALADEPAIEWSPALTSGVLARHRRERRRARWLGAAAAAAILPVAWLGLRVVSGLGVLRPLGETAEGLGIPADPADAIARIGSALGALGGDVLAALGRVPPNGAPAVALVGIAALLALNAIVVGRQRLARGRHS